MRIHEPVCVVHPGHEQLSLAGVEQHVRVVYVEPARRLPAVVSGLGCHPVILLGHASAGPIVLRFALEHPAAVSGLVLYSPAADDEDLSALTLPTLIVTGAHDAVCSPSRAALLHGRIGGSALLVLPGSGSQAHLSQPVAFTGAVAEFIHLVIDVT
ncbi:alpha/beta hydrolase [Actinoplanes sp. NPDC048796]|uniref:alpha/beta fold hydrolase n=1 Tax=unclassified Actinoplanes TaxID=2626549 RepID=UPI0033FB5F41